MSVRQHWLSVQFMGEPMMSTEFQKGAWTQDQSPRRAKSPEENKCEHACLLLALGGEEIRPVLTETLSQSGSQEILRTHQAGMDMGPPTRAKKQRKGCLGKS